MGAPLVGQLSENPENEVVVTTRRERESRGNVTYVCGNAHEPAFLFALLEKTHFDAVVDFMAYSTAEFSARFERILEKTGHYIFLSSARVYADREHPIRESSPRLLDVSEDKKFLASDEYALAKARQENLLAASPRKNWTIVRPSITYSDTRLQFGVLEKEEWLYRALHGRSIVATREINEKLTTMTHGSDVARATAALIGVPAAFGETFHITCNAPRKWKEIFACYCRILKELTGTAPRIFEVGNAESVAFHGGEYQLKYARMLDRAFDNSKIAKFIDVSAFLPPEEGLRRSLEAFLKNPKFGKIRWGAEAIKDRLSGERTPLSEIPGVSAKLEYVLVRRVPAVCRLRNGLRKICRKLKKHF